MDKFTSGGKQRRGLGEVFYEGTPLGDVQYTLTVSRRNPIVGTIIPLQGRPNLQDRGKELTLHLDDGSTLQFRIDDVGPGLRLFTIQALGGIVPRPWADREP